MAKSKLRVYWPLPAAVAGLQRLSSLSDDENMFVDENNFLL